MSVLSPVGRGHRARAGLAHVAAAVAAASLLAACGSSAPHTVDTIDVGVLNSGGDSLDWSPCDTIACATLTVPVDQAQPDAATVALRVYARPSESGGAAPVLVLIGDRESAMSARELVRDAPLTLGGRIAGYTVVSLSARGSADASVSDDALARSGSATVVEDLEALVRALGVDSVSVIGWGDGATVGALWVMTHPATVSSAVLDTPADPSASFLRQGLMRTDALASGVEQMMRWCASHLSCPFNAETRRGWLAMMEAIDTGNAPANLTRALINQAGHAALVTSDYSGFFRALDQALNDDATALTAMAGSVPQVSAGAWHCADYRRSAVRALAQRWASTKWRWFTPGSWEELYSRCAALGDPPAPLGATVPEAAATGARVFVTLARFDPTTGVDAPFAMAKKMKWKYRSVPAVRHFVVGYDAAITGRVLTFLVG